MIQELGYCNGIENYSRHLTGRHAGEPPPTLIDYFPKDFLLFIDESHIAVPGLQGMYRGDRARKETLVEYGFRLPSALDNRPLRFEETQERFNQVVYVSATPADYELEQAKDAVVELIVRPTGLVDPTMEVRSARNQVDDLFDELRSRQQRGERVPATTLTKRMAEDLTEYYSDLGVRVRYLHSDIHTLERMEIIRDLRLGRFDVLVGINLLREEVSTSPRCRWSPFSTPTRRGSCGSKRSLIQTCGRAARNLNGTVIMYADTVTRSMQQALDETSRRRTIQEAYNARHHITPENIQKAISQTFDFSREAKSPGAAVVAESLGEYASAHDIDERIRALEKEMCAAAKELDFEHAVELRDRIKALRQLLVLEDYFEKGPISALRFISLALRRTISTPHAARFARFRKRDPFTKSSQ